jgi:hypothetical protein
MAMMQTISAVSQLTTLSGMMTRMNHQNLLKMTLKKMPQLLIFQ